MWHLLPLSPQVYAALLSVACSFATIIGGLSILVLDLGANERDLEKKKAKYDFQLGHSLSFASGVMIYISFSDMFFEAVHEIGFFYANIWLFFGFVFFAFASRFVPEPDELLVSVATATPTITTTTPKNTSNVRSHFISNHKSNFDEIQKHSVRKRKLKDTQSVTTHIDSNHIPNITDGISSAKRGKLYSTGVIAAFAVAIHNLPEGLAVYLAGLEGRNRSTLVLGIFLHNIPEGLAVAMPLYAATGSKGRSILWASLSGLAEPIGAIVMGTLIAPHMSRDNLNATLAFVAGIMLYISFADLYPTALTCISGQQAAMSCFLGMVVVFGGVHTLHAAIGQVA